MSTFGQVVLSQRSFDEAARGAGLTPAQAERTKVSTVVLPEANVVEVFVLGPRKDLSERMLSLLGSESTRYFESLYTVYAVRTLDIEHLQAVQVAPKPVQSALIAGALGVSLAFLVGLAVDRLRAGRSSTRGNGRADTHSGSAQREPPPGSGGTPALAQWEPTAAPDPLPPQPKGLPGGSDSSPHGHALVVSPGVDVYAKDRSSLGDVIDDPDWWLTQLHELGREVRRWPHEVSVARGEVDDQGRWRSELDDVGRLLRGWAEEGRVPRGEAERPDPPTPS